jgi:foldase protein PrsA
MSRPRREKQADRQANDNKGKKVPPVSHRHHAAFLALSLTTLLAACSNSNPAIVSVNGTTVSKAEFDARLDRNTQLAEEQLADMVQGLALDQYAAAHGIVISDAEIAEAQAQLEAQSRPGGLDEILRQRGLGDAAFKNLIRRRLIVEHAVGSKSAITEKAIRDFYRQNPYAFNRPAQVRARQILVPDLATAKVVEAKLKAGGNFAALARQYSTDAPSRDHDGDLGYFSGGDVVPELVKGAFAQRVGAIGPPVKSSFGYHIVQVEDRRPALLHPPLAQVREKVRDRIWQIAAARAQPAIISAIMQNMKITIYDQRFADLPDAIRRSSQSPQ